MRSLTLSNVFKTHSIYHMPATPAAYHALFYQRFRAMSLSSPSDCTTCAGGAPRVIALAEELRRPTAGGIVGKALPPAWLCDCLLRPLISALDNPDSPARCGLRLCMSLLAIYCTHGHMSMADCMKSRVPVCRTLIQCTDMLTSIYASTHSVTATIQSASTISICDTVSDPYQACRAGVRLRPRCAASTPACGCSSLAWTPEGGSQGLRAALPPTCACCGACHAGATRSATGWN